MKDWLRKNGISLASALVALAALGLAIYTAWLNRDYLRRSHRPQMGGSFWYNEKGSGFDFGNLGVGVAYLKWFQVEVDGKAVGSWSSMINALHLSDDELPKGPQSMDAYIHFNNPREIYAAGQTYPHFTVSPGPPESAFRKQGERVNLRACYCSIFDECWEVGSISNVPTPRESCFPYPDVRFGAPSRLRAAGEGKRTLAPLPGATRGLISAGRTRRLSRRFAPLGTPYGLPASPEAIDRKVVNALERCPRSSFRTEPKASQS